MTVKEEKHASLVLNLSVTCNTAANCFSEVLWSFPISEAYGKFLRLKICKYHKSLPYRLLCLLKLYSKSYLGYSASHLSQFILINIYHFSDVKKKNALVIQRKILI